MRIFKIGTALKRKKPLTAKQKEQITTAFGTVFIVVLTITSAFAVDARNSNLVSIMKNNSQETFNG